MNKLNCDLAMPACSLRHMHDKINEIIDNMGSGGGGGSAPFNLLDNTDFSNPYNQRGQGSYTGAVYGLDRWRSWEAGNIVTVGDGCITLAGTVNFLQYVPPELLHEGKTYTFVVTKKDGSVMTVSGTYPMSTDAIVGGVSMKLDNDAPYVAILYAGDYINAALYEGEYTAETLPKYAPKGYSVERAECNRYFRQYFCNRHGFIGMYDAPTQKCYIEIVFEDHPMRTIPTVIGSGHFYASGPQTGNTGTDVSVHNSNTFKITMKVSPHAGAVAGLYLFNPQFDISLSADL